MSHLPDFLANHTILLLLFFLTISSWLIFEMYSRGKTISAHELVKLINSDSILLLDTRSQTLFQQQHIAHSYHVPQENMLTAVDNLLKKHQGKQVVIMNESGMSPAALVQHISKQKFTVFSLKGGIAQWVQENLPVISDQQEKKNKANKKVIAHKSKK